MEEASRSECDLKVKFEGLYRRKEGWHDFVLYATGRWNSELGQIALRCMHSYLEIFVCYVRKNVERK